jgi:hypothetical protein
VRYRFPCRGTPHRSRTSSCIERHVGPDVDAETKLHAHAFHELAAHLDHLLLELEWRNAEGQKAADALIAIEHHGLDAVTHQDIGAAQTRRTRTDDRNALAVGRTFDMSGLPAALDRLVGDVFLDRADRDGAQAVVQRAGALAQPVLRTDTAADSGKEFVLWDSSAASNRLPSWMRFSQLGM